MGIFASPYWCPVHTYSMQLAGVFSIERGILSSDWTVIFVFLPQVHNKVIHFLNNIHVSFSGPSLLAHTSYCKGKSFTYNRLLHDQHLCTSVSRGNKNKPDWFLNCEGRCQDLFGVSICSEWHLVVPPVLKSLCVNGVSTTL